MNLPAAALLGLLAGAEAKPSTWRHPLLARQTQEDVLLGNPAKACTDATLHAKKAGDDDDANEYSVTAECSTDSASLVASLDLNRCIMNDNGKLAWGSRGGFVGSCKDCRPAGFWPSPFMTCSCVKKTELAPADKAPDQNNGNVIQLGDYIVYKDGKLSCDFSSLGAYD